jgi:adenylate cyclase
MDFANFALPLGSIRLLFLFIWSPISGLPSIAVLPFQNMSTDPKQGYFAEGVVEDIITALSQMRWLFVIARSSSFAFKGDAFGIASASGAVNTQGGESSVI